MRGQVRIDQMYAFIVIDDDGTEGIPAIKTMNMGYPTALPLVGADMAHIDSIRHFAEKIARDMKKPVLLVKFTNREEVEIIR